jgi:Tol biopolymer transport system component
VRRVTSSSRFDWPSAWTPGGKQLLLVSNRDGTDDVFAQAPGTDTAVPLVHGKNARTPQVSPDGKWLLYELWTEAEVAPSREPVKVMRQPMAGGPAALVFEARGRSGSGNFRGWGSEFPEIRCPSSAGASCVIAEEAGGSVVFTAFDALAGRQKEVGRASAPPNRISWDVSPDGSRIAYVRWGWNEQNPIVILSMSDHRMREIAVKGWTSLSSLAWAADGNGLFLVSAKREKGQLLHMDLAGAIAILRDDPGQWQMNPRPAPDGRTLAFATATTDSNIWLIEP